MAPEPDELLAADYILAVAASTWLPRDIDPLWGWLIGPPGAMKTELIRSFRGFDDVYFLSTLTPQSLISGYERTDGTDPSILPLLDGKLLAIKDFTSVMGLPENSTRQIFGDLRGIYDGFHGKAFGTVGLREYTSRFTLLAAVTPAIDHYTIVHADLGERFLSLRIGKYNLRDMELRIRKIEHVQAAMATKAVWRKSLLSVVHGAFAEIKKTLATPKWPLVAVTADQERRLVRIADCLCLMRSLSAPTSQAHTQSTAPPPEPEVASRAVQQLSCIATGRAIADNRTTMDSGDLALARRVALDSVPSSLSHFIRLVRSGGNDGMTETELLGRLRYPQWWTCRILDHYKAVGVIDQRRGKVRLTEYLARTLWGEGIDLPKPGPAAPSSAAAAPSVAKLPSDPE